MLTKFTNKIKLSQILAYSIAENVGLFVLFCNYLPSQNAIRTILLTLLRQLANFEVNSKFQKLFHLFDFSLFSSQFFVFRLIYFVSI
jgi:hypothetical protein